jgi:polysaccharide biosynthesis transport protein
VETPFATLGSPSGTFDIRTYLLVLSRRRWLIAVTFVVVFSAVALQTLRQPKIYESSTTLIIDTTQPQFLDDQVKEVLNTSTGAYWSMREYAETQERVIQSRSVAQRVVEKLGLENDPAFLGVRPPTTAAEREALSKSADAVALLQGRISVVPIKDSRIVKITVADTSPERAALLANEVATAYLDENLALKLRTTESATRWLEDRKAELEGKNKASETAVYDFQKRQDMLTASAQDRASMVSQRLTTYNTALTDVRTRNAGLKARADAIRKIRSTIGKNEEDEVWAEALGSADGALIQQLRVRYLSEEADCAALSAQYLPDHPKLLACRDKANSTKRDLLKALDSTVVGAEAELYEGQLKERNLSALLDDAKAEAYAVNGKQIEFEHLRREADNDQRLYDLVLKRLKDIELSGLLRNSNARVLDSARAVMAPVQPKVARSLLYGLVLGLIAGLGLALLIEQLDTSLATQADVESRLGIPFLGLLPRIPVAGEDHLLERDLYVLHHPRSALAEACRALRTNLLFMSPDEAFRTMLVTSSAPREGKTTTVISLGIAMAQSGSRVLLIDSDMRRPRLNRAFGVSGDIGLSSVVVADSTLSDAIKSTEVPGLFILPCGPIPPNPSEMFHSKAFAAILETVRSQFDRVLLDSPPVNAVADAVVLATQVDGVTLVPKGGFTNRANAQRAVRVLQDVKARIFGATLNDVDVTDPRYGDFYAAYHQYEYAYGYAEQKDGHPV